MKWLFVTELIKSENEKREIEGELFKLMSIKSVEVLLLDNKWK